MDAMDKAYGDWLREQVELFHQSKIRIPGHKEGFEAGWRAATSMDKNWQTFEQWWAWFWDEPKGTKGMELFKAATESAWQAATNAERKECVIACVKVLRDKPGGPVTQYQAGRSMGCILCSNQILARDTEQGENNGSKG